MPPLSLHQLYGSLPLLPEFQPDSGKRYYIRGLSGSFKAILASILFKQWDQNQVFILNDKETAAYFFNDLENLLGQSELDTKDKSVLFFPTSYKKPYSTENIDNANVLSRSEVLTRLSGNAAPLIIITYPEALGEKVVSKAYLQQAVLKISRGEKLNLDFLTDVFHEYGFERTDFVIEAGQYSIRGGLVDVFSYADDYPYRIEFDGDEIDSIRTFDPVSQLSKQPMQSVSVLPNVHDRLIREQRQGFLELFENSVPVWIEDTGFLLDKIEKEYRTAENAFLSKTSEIKLTAPDSLYIESQGLLRKIQQHPVVEFGLHFFFKDAIEYQFNITPQPPFHKNFELLLQNLEENTLRGYQNIILTNNEKQEERLKSILLDLLPHDEKLQDKFQPLRINLHEGFIDHDRRIACYTDHQIFDRFHRFQLRESFAARESLTIKELYSLKPGDYITHIDHGVGRFDGLEIIDNNGRKQEAIRLFYKNNDILYVSIHSLHRITKFSGRDGTVPSLDKLGSGAWARIKDKTKRRVKDIAKDLIRLYAERRRSKGFSYSADTYLQNELEASFIYEDTPDQVKSTQDVKRDLEADFPMDRLICGDVGFGKTEIAVRAAFKTVTDSKQVAVLVPTTILALQHYHTFKDRLEKFPCKVDYLNRFRSGKEQKEVLKELVEGKVDIVIGTHRLLSEDIKFKDLGLLILDEEQKFGVAAKEKLKKLRVNVDTLTLTATPIPRTLQFSLMGARDLSIITTPPPNRQPVQTEIRPFNEEIIRDAIQFELSRNGQVFFVHNRIQNISDVAGLIRKYVPDARVAVAHGQMEGHQLEKIMLAFIEGEFDVLVATTIIESGLDIPNANTIFINDAHHYGLSDLHQLRGRVGRSNRKAFCYLLSPPVIALTDEARKRLQAIEEFADLGGGFNIAMRDLDIRGAGNILGAEQSGFISEIGYEMYQKILDEAILELKETEFPELLGEQIEKSYVRDCVLETDMEILIPDDYVNHITERLNLYKELDSIDNEEDLSAFQEKLIDRFGPIPGQTAELFNAVRLRWLAREIGFEKIVLRNSMMTGYFVTNPESPYYQSENFTRVLQYVQTNPRLCSMKEGNEKLSLTFKTSRTLEDGLKVFRTLLGIE
ncbi:MAG: transcription-repair coupling factor [Bacteroidales bacterium]